MTPTFRKHFIILLIAALSFGYALPTFADVPNIIFDTDFAPDVDDVGALAVLHALADNGEANILGAITSSSHHWSPGAIDAINTYYGRPDIPIGGGHYSPRPKGNIYSKRLANSAYGNDIMSLDDVPNAAALYRQLLNKQANDSITIVTVGFLTNLSDLLDTPVNYEGDGIMKTGVQLVREKVHHLVTMGGKYPAGLEFNFAAGRENPDSVVAYTQNVLSNWPTPIFFIGDEIGSPILTGAGLSETPADNPVRIAYEIYMGPGNNRPSWDQAAVLYAVRGPTFRGTRYWTEVNEGFNEIVDARGTNAWRLSPDKNHSYVVKALPISQMQEVIEDLMMQQPAGGSPNHEVSRNVLLYYDFRDGRGRTVTDLSSHGNHGMLVGFSDTSAGAGNFNTNEGWLTGGGLSFLDGGTNDRNYVETPLPLNALFDSDQKQNKSFTVELVANWTGSTGWTPIIGSNYGCSFSIADAFFIGLHKSLQGIHLFVPGAHSKTFDSRSNPWITPDTGKHHIAMTFDQATNRAELFVDGIPVGSATFSRTNFNSRSLFRIGNTGWNDAEQWGGIIYSLAISDELLSPDEFVLIYSELDES